MVQKADTPYELPADRKNPVGVSLLAIALRQSTHVLKAECNREQAHAYRAVMPVSTATPESTRCLPGAPAPWPPTPRSRPPDPRDRGCAGATCRRHGPWSVLRAPAHANNWPTGARPRPGPGVWTAPGPEW